MANGIGRKDFAEKRYLYYTAKLVAVQRKLPGLSIEFTIVEQLSSTAYCATRMLTLPSHVEYHHRSIEGQQFDDGPNCIPFLSQYR
jgi:hypothetical protein